MQPFCQTQQDNPGLLPHNQVASWPPPAGPALRNQLDDPYLLALATTDFSSPSLPPLDTPPRTLPGTPLAFDLPKPLDIGQSMPFPPQRRPSRPSRSSGGIVDLTKEEPSHDDAASILRHPPASLPMPSIPQHSPGSAANAASSMSASLRKRRASLSQTQAQARPAKTRKPDDADPFHLIEDDDPFATEPADNAEQSIDLSNATEVPKELLVPKVDNRIKLAKFQCVICMDDVTALTVTHCGHLFCSECLHSALHIDSNKKTCPVCRTKVDLKNSTKTKATKTFFHLELKLMTATKQGKRPAG